MLEQRGILVPEAVRGRITRRMDPHVMRDWFRRAFAAAAAGQVFGDE
ncbi:MULTISPECIES: hypothetical protein [Streptomyces]|uniref:Uncharacterized protein n=2 Tax=Streptomyces TaxID=1883 RepID=A0A1D8G4W4_9ACTN|nr:MULTISPECIES: hypothetical protein [Streptomyces]AOT60485.1 hypothetical protein A4G23_03360 [Streptomyces rubrolavendulae]KAF0650608.1 hypothetical protein K701_06310 [Streptomyces fradiae ATCC 10745 = DSM 40063]OSY50742.1 hypothetical protein BG846_03633 [Streptomyces fradiae ATCC 10745 = DSM 40063]